MKLESSLFESFLKNYDQPVFAIIGENEIKAISEGALEMVNELGFTNIESDLKFHFSKENYNTFISALDSCLNGYPTKGLHLGLKPKNNSNIAYYDFSFYCGKKGQTGFIVCKSIDEELDAIELLQQSEMKHRLLFTKANDAIVIIQNLEIVDCNEKTLSMFESPGFSGISGKKLYHFMPEKQPDGTDSILKYHYLIQEAAEGKSQFFQWRHSKLSGEQFETEVSLNAFELDNEQFVQVIIRDITKRTEADFKRKQSEKSYFDLFNSSVDSIFIINQHEEITDANKKARSLLGKSFNKKAFHLKHLFNEKELIYALKSIRKKDYLGVKRLTSTLSVKNKKIPVDLAIYASSFYGKDVFVVNARDISEQLAYEKSIKESENNYRLLVNALSDAILVVKNDQIVFANDSVKQFLKTDTAIQKNVFSDLFKPEDYQRVIALTLKKIKSPNSLQRISCELQNLEKQVEVECISAGPTELDEMKFVIHDVSSKKTAEKAKKRAVVAEEANEKLQKEIKVRIKAEAEVLKAQQYTRSIIDSSIDMIVAVNKNGQITDYNTAASDGFGYQPEELYKLDIQKLFVLPDQSVYTLKEIIDKGYFSGEILFQKANNTHFTAYLSASMLRNELGESMGTVGVIKDITPLKKAEQKLKENIFQKEILLKEVHHRVKNNLQVIISILKLQSGYIDDPNTVLKLQECQDRIKSMAFIHESLYQSEDLSHINFGQYLKNLVTNLAHSYRIDTSKIAVTYEINDLEMSLDNAIPCGLIVNELVSNALKYAFPNQQKGEVIIELKEDRDEKILIVRDNGVGLNDKLNFRETDSLGLQLVVTLVQQIDGEIEYQNSDGAQFTINFKGR